MMMRTSVALALLRGAAAGACSADDVKSISDPNTIGKKAGDCGKSSYNVITGNFNHDKFNSCLTASAGISSSCSECFAVSGEYGAKNCKAACILGWCKSDCLDCVKAAQPALDACTGSTSGSATPCLEVESDVPRGKFLGGMIEGFFGKSSGLETCVKSGDSVTKAIKQVVSDLKKHKFGPAARELSAVFGDIKHSLEECKRAGHDLTEITAALKDVHSVQDMLFHIKADILTWDRVMLDELGHAGKVCTFHSPDAHECGKLIGEGSRHLIIGDSPKSILGDEKINTNFFRGMLTALLGESTEIKHCVGDVGVTAGHAKDAIGHLRKRELEKVFKDVRGLMDSTKNALGDCKDAKNALEPFLHITKKQMRKNYLDNDKQVLDEVQNMFSSCTYVKPNGEKCGADIGTIARLVLVGRTSDVIV